MKRRKYLLRRLERSGEADDAGDSWLLSYADMMSLLFALFTVLYGMSKMNEENFRALAEALSRNLSTGGVVSKDPNKKDTINNNQEVNKDKIQQKKLEKFLKDRIIEIKKEEKSKKDAIKQASRRKMMKIEQKINILFKEKHLNQAVIVKLEERGLIVSLLTDKLLFVIGKADLTARCKKVLEVIVPILREYDNPLRIEGNTCNIPIGNGEFESNWELSTMRATNVAKYFIMKKNIKPERISIVGYGEYQPMFQNTTENNRIKNRRVDIVILHKRKANGKSH